MNSLKLIYTVNFERFDRFWVILAISTGKRFFYGLHEGSFQRIIWTNREPDNSCQPNFAQVTVSNIFHREKTGKGRVFSARFLVTVWQFVPWMCQDNIYANFWWFLGENADFFWSQTIPSQDGITGNETNPDQEICILVHRFAQTLPLKPFNCTCEL